MEQGQRTTRLLDYLRHELPGLLSVFAFLAITAVLFRSWEFSLMVTASLGFHELGHVVALAWYKQEYKIFFGVVGAWTWSRVESRSALSHLSNTYIHLAGPVFSLILSLSALSLNRLWNPPSLHLMLLANFSAQVGFLNLLPVGIYTDGGKALRRMVISAREGKGRMTILLLASAAVIGPAFYAIMNIQQLGPDHLNTRLLGLLLIGVWLAAGAISELRRVGAPRLTGCCPMRPRQLTFIGIFIWDLLMSQFIVIAATPFWLSSEYLTGLLQNMTWVISGILH